MSDECKDFIIKCLDKDPMKRLGNNGGVKEIMAHPWLTDIDATKLVAKEYSAPY